MTFVRCFTTHRGQPLTIATTLWAWPPGGKPHLSAAFSIDVDGRGRHHAAVLHLPGVRTVLKNPVVVSDT